MTETFLLEKAKILPVGIRRDNATTYAVITIFVNIPVEKTLYEKLVGTVMIIKVSQLNRESMQTQINRLTKPFITVACHCTELP